MVAVFTAVVGGVIVWLALRESFQYTRGDSLLDARQFRFRMIGAGVLLALLAMMCVGVYVIHFTELTTFTLYWSAFAAACVIPVVMSLLDLRRVNRLRREKQHALDKEFAEFIRRQSDRPNHQPPETGGQGESADD